MLPVEAFLSKVTLAENPIKITKDTKELVYSATLDKKAPTGQHKSLFCQIVITQNGEPIAHNVGGGGVLRIDAPPPPKKEEKPKPAKVAKAKPQAAPKPKTEAKPKPRSRLQKLRLEARKRAEEQK